MEKTLTLHNKSTINANGNLNSRRCKPVICIDTGEVFTSVTDAAKSIGVSTSNMSDHLNGRYNTIHKKRYCYLSAATENLDAIVTRLRQVSAMETDARKWREYEAALKAEEARKVAIAKAEERVARCVKMYERANQKLTEAKCELNMLKGAEVA